VFTSHTASEGREASERGEGQMSGHWDVGTKRCDMARHNFVGDRQIQRNSSFVDRWAGRDKLSRTRESSVTVSRPVTTLRADGPTDRLALDQRPFPSVYQSDGASPSRPPSRLNIEQAVVGMLLFIDDVRIAKISVRRRSGTARHGGMRTIIDESDR